MITFFRAALKDSPGAESADLVFLGQEWQVGKIAHKEEHLRMILSARWTFAVWKRMTVTPTSTAAPDFLKDPLPGPAPGDTVLTNPRTLTVDVTNYMIDQTVLQQHRDDKALLETIRKQMVHARNLKPGCLVGDGRFTRGELIRVEFSKPEPPPKLTDPGSRFSSLRDPPVRLGPPREIEVVELEWSMGSNEELGTLDDLIDF